MANFPTWINKNKNTKSTMNSSQLSPRQVANKALSLAVKKLDKDDKRRRPQYTVRERLLLSNTMARAEDLLNKRTPRSNRRVLMGENDDDVLPPAKKMAFSPPPPLALPVEKKQEKVAVVVEEPKQVLEPIAIVTPTPQVKNESPLMAITIEQQMAISLAVVAAAAFSTLTAAEQQSLINSSRDICRPIMIPSHTTMTSITTII